MKLHLHVERSLLRGIHYNSMSDSVALKFRINKRLIHSNFVTIIVKKKILIIESTTINEEAFPHPKSLSLIIITSPYVTN